MIQQSWIQRFDVAKLLETSLDLSYWKGDEHTKGVFFTDEYGYTLNKVLAIRVKHNEEAPEVFYSFTAKNEDESVITSYPFEELELKPKNHHLLFNDLKLKKEEINNVFDVSYTYGETKVETEPLVQLLESVNSKRERERSFLSFKIKDGIGTFEIVRKKKKERIVSFREIIQCDKITAADVIAAQKNATNPNHIEAKKVEKEKVGAVNAHTMLYILKIFSSFKSVLFSFSHDRIMITGDKQKAIDVHLPIAEVVIALTKNI